MRRLIAALFLLVASASAHATDPQARGGVPTWLLGKWVVTKVYEDANETYPVPSAEPEVWLGGKTMSVEPNRLSLGGEICTDFGVEPKRGTIRQILKTMSGQTPQQIGLNAKRGQVSYLKVTCGRSFTEETAERVDEINQRLRDDGYEVPKPSRLHGSWTFYFNAPGGFMVEVLH